MPQLQYEDTSRGLLLRKSHPGALNTRGAPEGAHELSSPNPEAHGTSPFRTWRSCIPTPPIKLSDLLTALNYKFIVSTRIVFLLFTVP